jgi:hypothetical protein
MYVANGLYGDNVKIIAINDIFEVSLIVYFLSKGQITQAPTVTVGLVVTERNVVVL